MDIQFPQYRRYLHGNTYYRVNSLENFDELMVVGKFYVFRNFQARILPEYQMIIDLIDNAENRWEVIGKEDFEKKLEFCRKNLSEKKLEL